MTLTVEVAGGTWSVPSQRGTSALTGPQQATVVPHPAGPRAVVPEDGVHCHLLGPLRVVLDGAEVHLNGAKERTVLAALLLHAGHVLDDHRLMQLLWDLNPPATSNAQIHSYVWRLRRKLGAGVTIHRQSSGYRLDARTARTDLDEFGVLTSTAHHELAEARHEQAASTFRRALALWRGPALPDVTRFLADKVVPRWEEVRMAALEGRINADLALGRSAMLVPELTSLVVEFPYREVLRAQLMAALYLGHRRVDALEVFHTGRRILVDEMGVDPGPALRGTHLVVLGDRSRAELLRACSGAARS